MITLTHPNSSDCESETLSFTHLETITSLFEPGIVTLL